MSLASDSWRSKKVSAYTVLGGGSPPRVRNSQAFCALVKSTFIMHVEEETDDDEREEDEEEWEDVEETEEEREEAEDDEREEDELSMGWQTSAVSPVSPPKDGELSTHDSSTGGSRHVWEG